MAATAGEDGRLLNATQYRVLLRLGGSLVALNKILTRATVGIVTSVHSNYVITVTVHHLSLIHI